MTHVALEQEAWVRNHEEQQRIFDQYTEETSDARQRFKIETEGAAEKMREALRLAREEREAKLNAIRCR